MGDPRGFIKVRREATQDRPVCERVKDYAHVAVLPSDKQSEKQASRCMDCGTPFCNWGCPLGNYIPEWNDLVFHDHWKRAIQLLSATNNMPEITGRVCPAPCEYACVLGINDDPVTIKENEMAIIEYAFKKNIIKPRAPVKRSGKKVAVIGSGPAGLSSAAQLNRAGHSVTVFEKDDRIGGILRYGIPDFKLEKGVLDRRIDIWKKEGVKFKTNVDVGTEYPVSKLSDGFDAIVVTCGSRVPRDLAIEGRGLRGIHFAMDYLAQANRLAAGDKIPKKDLIDAKGKKVLVIGGGDTGADCIGTAHRQDASCVVQIEILPRPSECRTEECPWPKYPMLLKTSSSHEEGGERRWSIVTKKFVGQKGLVKKVLCRENSGGDFEIEADLVLLAIGFLYAEPKGLVEELGLELDKCGNVVTNASFMTSVKKVFCAGDMRRGQSLVVWAIDEGRKAAYNVDRFLTGEKI
ncbi:MAG: glutamate synthase subunit beta [Candidatus Omnitrophica bacterium]|nr:glutamate synthase subunit beta [Candidatus Omnitrophota bacterium]MBU4488826.1 glutamate synthase subunit beta [Candidatus Omnitrophota bacterium]MCG2704716.1 glutamate synthase subunit beta [Candidatus Omnitrophota bacterium]